MRLLEVVLPRMQSWRTMLLAEIGLIGLEVLPMCSTVLLHMHKVELNRTKSQFLNKLVYIWQGLNRQSTIHRLQLPEHVGAQCLSRFDDFLAFLLLCRPTRPQSAPRQGTACDNILETLCGQPRLNWVIGFPFRATASCGRACQDSTMAHRHRPACFFCTAGVAGRLQQQRIPST